MKKKIKWKDEIGTMKKGNWNLGMDFGLGALEIIFRCPKIKEKCKIKSTIFVFIPSFFVSIFSVQRREEWGNSVPNADERIFISFFPFHRWIVFVHIFHLHNSIFLLLLNSSSSSLLISIGTCRMNCKKKIN